MHSMSGTGEAVRAILGSFSFDENGDTTAGSVTSYRVVAGKPKVVGLITPSRALVR
jgi:hypothetical protein